MMTVDEQNQTCLGSGLEMKAFELNMLQQTPNNNTLSDVKQLQELNQTIQDILNTNGIIPRQLWMSGIDYTGLLLKRFHLKDNYLTYHKRLGNYLKTIKEFLYLILKAPDYNQQNYIPISHIDQLFDLIELTSSMLLQHDLIPLISFLMTNPSSNDQLNSPPEFSSYVQSFFDILLSLNGIIVSHLDNLVTYYSFRRLVTLIFRRLMKNSLIPISGSLSIIQLFSKEIMSPLSLSCSSLSFEVISDCLTDTFVSILTTLYQITDDPLSCIPIPNIKELNHFPLDDRILPTTVTNYNIVPLQEFFNMMMLQEIHDISLLLLYCGSTYLIPHLLGIVIIHTPGHGINKQTHQETMIIIDSVSIVSKSIDTIGNEIGFKGMSLRLSGIYAICSIMIRLRDFQLYRPKDTLGPILQRFLAYNIDQSLLRLQESHLTQAERNGLWNRVKESITLDMSCIDTKLCLFFDALNNETINDANIEKDLMGIDCTAFLLETFTNVSDTITFIQGIQQGLQNIESSVWLQHLTAHRVLRAVEYISINASTAQIPFIWKEFLKITDDLIKDIVSFNNQNNIDIDLQTTQTDHTSILINESLLTKKKLNLCYFCKIVAEFIQHITISEGYLSQFIIFSKNLDKLIGLFISLYPIKASTKDYQHMLTDHEFFTLTDIHSTSLIALIHSQLTICRQINSWLKPSCLYYLPVPSEPTDLFQDNHTADIIRQMIHNYVQYNAQIFYNMSQFLYYTTQPVDMINQCMIELDSSGTLRRLFSGATMQLQSFHHESQTNVEDVNNSIHHIGYLGIYYFLTWCHNISQKNPKMKQLYWDILTPELYMIINQLFNSQQDDILSESHSAMSGLFNQKPLHIPTTTQLANFQDSIIDYIFSEYVDQLITLSLNTVSFLTISGNSNLTDIKEFFNHIGYTIQLQIEKLFIHCLPSIQQRALYQLRDFVIKKLLSFCQMSSLDLPKLLQELCIIVSILNYSTCWPSILSEKYNVSEVCSVIVSMLEIFQTYPQTHEPSKDMILGGIILYELLDWILIQIKETTVSIHHSIKPFQLIIKLFFNYLSNDICTINKGILYYQVFGKWLPEKLAVCYTHMRQRIYELCDYKQKLQTRLNHIFIQLCDPLIRYDDDIPKKNDTSWILHYPLCITFFPKENNVFQRLSKYMIRSQNNKQQPDTIISINDAASINILSVCLETIIVPMITTCCVDWDIVDQLIKYIQYISSINPIQHTIDTSTNDCPLSSSHYLSYLYMEAVMTLFGKIIHILQSGKEFKKWHNHHKNIPLSKLIELLFVFFKKMNDIANTSVVSGDMISHHTTAYKSLEGLLSLMVYQHQTTHYLEKPNMTLLEPTIKQLDIHRFHQHPEFLYVISSLFMYGKKKMETFYHYFNSNDTIHASSSYYPVYQSCLKWITDITVSIYDPNFISSDYSIQLLWDKLNQTMSSNCMLVIVGHLTQLTIKDSSLLQESFLKPMSPSCNDIFFYLDSLCYITNSRTVMVRLTRKLFQLQEQHTEHPETNKYGKKSRIITVLRSIINLGISRLKMNLSIEGDCMNNTNIIQMTDAIMELHSQLVYLKQKLQKLIYWFIEYSRVVQLTCQIHDSMKLSISSHHYNDFWGRTFVFELIDLCHLGCVQLKYSLELLDSFFLLFDKDVLSHTLYEEHTANNIVEFQSGILVFFESVSILSTYALQSAITVRKDTCGELSTPTVHLHRILLKRSFILQFIFSSLFLSMFRLPSSECALQLARQLTRIWTLIYTSSGHSEMIPLRREAIYIIHNMMNIDLNSDKLSLRSKQFKTILKQAIQAKNKNYLNKSLDNDPNDTTSIHIEDHQWIRVSKCIVSNGLYPLLEIIDHKLKHHLFAIMNNEARDRFQQYYETFRKYHSYNIQQRRE